MNFNDAELAQRGQLLNHVFFGLTSDSLIHSDWIYGPEEQIKTEFKMAESDGIVCSPSNPGAELFLSAFGEVHRRLEYIFDYGFSAAVDGIPEGFALAVATKV